MSTHSVCFYGEITKIIPKLSLNTLLICCTVMIQSFRTDMPGQTVQTKIRGAVWSGSTLFAIPSALFGLITL